MRGRGVTVLATAVLVLLTAGCVKQESPASSYYLSPQVLGTTSSGESLDTTAPAPQPGVQDATFPRAAFADTPGANQITVATGDTAISRGFRRDTARSLCLHPRSVHHRGGNNPVTVSGFSPAAVGRMVSPTQGRVHQP